MTVQRARVESSVRTKLEAEHGVWRRSRRWRSSLGCLVGSSTSSLCLLRRRQTRQACLDRGCCLGVSTHQHRGEAQGHELSSASHGEWGGGDWSDESKTNLDAPCATGATAARPPMISDVPPPPPEQACGLACHFVHLALPVQQPARHAGMGSPPGRAHCGRARIEPVSDQHHDSSDDADKQAYWSKYHATSTTWPQRRRWARCWPAGATNWRRHCYLHVCYTCWAIPAGRRHACPEWRSRLVVITWSASSAAAATTKPTCAAFTAAIAAGANIIILTSYAASDMPTRYTHTPITTPSLSTTTTTFAIAVTATAITATAAATAAATTSAASLL